MGNNLRITISHAISMIANAFLYRLISPLTVSAAELEEALEPLKFVECGPTQEKSTGFVPSRGKAHGALVEAIDGHWILKVATETRSVPAKIIKKNVEEKCAQIEAQTGRKPGKKERRDMTDEVRLTLLPSAFPKETHALVWIDRSSNTVMVEGSSQNKADEVVTLLIKGIQGLQMALINTQQSPTQAMAQWLVTQETPEKFEFERECELKACDESRGTVKYNKLSLETEEVKKHIQQGHLPTRLALTWNDRVSFVLTDGLQLKKLAILDVVFEEAAGSDKDDSFDADVSIMTGELSAMIADLVQALGGEVAAEPTGQ